MARPSKARAIARLQKALDDRGWKMDLIRELKNVGFDVDANRAL